MESVGEKEEREKLPSKSVVTPVVVPLNITLANGTGSPEPASVTLPVTLVSCAMAANVVSMKNATNNPNLDLKPFRPMIEASKLINKKHDLLSLLMLYRQRLL